ncbi:hypothetical protein Gferi_13575 [Geosporobacter ferrireducens]|uniref:PAC domain-containing protein n=2 Tax=Geosporobacter ferrireducens TaxID=1424294 RepID=A0A1D8GQD6_9FIRM|nr:hypothetical protein Gferi_13575 [Geosporobacter ferrireducens]
MHMKKELELQLKKQRKFFEDILSGMKDWVRVIDRDNRVLFLNEPMKKQVGDTTGQQCFKALNKKEPCENCITNRAIFEGKSITKEEVVGDKIFSVVSSPIYDEENNIQYAVEVFRDITEKRAMEELILEQNTKMKRDLNFAKQLQHKILPENRIYNNTLKIVSVYIPCELLGGDVYDVIEINENYIGMYIADVSGHGVTSSMMTMFIRQTLKSLEEKAIDPAVTLRYLYHRYRELHIDDQYYITVFYGVYDKKNKSFCYSNAGHNCMPIVLRKNYVEEVYMPGFPICTVFEDVQYENEVLTLHSGDRLLFYTDGIVEAVHPDKGFYQNDRILELCTSYLKEDMEPLMEAIITDVQEFAQGEIKDDIAIMMAQIL